MLSEYLFMENQTYTNKTRCDIVKECPFCNSTNILIKRNFDYVRCNDCGARGPVMDGHVQDSIDGWNRPIRVPHEQPPIRKVR